VFTSKSRAVALSAALALAATLTVAGCSSDNGDGSASPEPTSPAIPSPTAEDIGIVDAIEVSGAADGDGTTAQAPTLSFDTPLEVSAPTARLLHEGTGEPLEAGMVLTFAAVTVDGQGEDVFSTWDHPEQPMTFTLGDASFAILTEPLTGANVGAQVLLANPSMTQEETPQPMTFVTFFEIVDAHTPPTRAQGETITPEPGLPTVTLGEDGQPSIDIPSGYQAPADLVVQTLIKGDGAVVDASNTLMVQYTGWTLDGEVFDSSWGRAPATFGLTQVIAGWTQGLAGQTVGSQVLLIIPPSLAYGGMDHRLAEETLIFVVDILEAS
jgi:peptidylprolyl isomerase